MRALFLCMLLSGCTMQSGIKLQCDAACRMEIDRGIDANAPGYKP